MRFQRFVTEPAFGRKVGAEQAGAISRRTDQLRQQFLTTRLAKVYGNRALALVHACPEQAVFAIVCQRPATMVKTATDRVETDDLGSELGQCHSTQRRGNKGRAFDDPQTLENSLHLSLQSRLNVSVASATR